jgi:hypothetical protein
MNNTLHHPAIHAVSHPDRPAFIMAASGEIVTYRDLERRSCQARLRPLDAAGASE